MKTSLIVIISVLTILILAVNDSQARLTSSVALSVKEDYNDNIFLTDNNKEDDFITKIGPSFTLNYKSGRHEAAIEYSYEWQDYAQNSEADDGRQQGSAKVTSVLIERLLTVNISDVYENTATDPRRSTNESEVLMNTVAKNTFTFNPVIYRNLSPVMTLSAGYEFIDADYNNDTSEDFRYNNLYLNLERRLSKRLTVSAKYGRDDKETEGDITEDFISQNASVSSTLQLTPSTSFDATFGRTWYDYETRSSAEENFWSFTASTKVMSTGTATLSYSRQSRDSVELGTYLSESASLRLSFGKRLKVSLGGVVKNDEYLTSAREDDKISGDASLSWQMTRKLKLTVAGDISNEKFTLPGEEVDRWGSSVAANYKLGKHFAVTASFKHRGRDSSIQRNSYENNVATVSVSAAY